MLALGPLLWLLAPLRGGTLGRLLLARLPESLGLVVSTALLAASSLVAAASLLGPGGLPGLALACGLIVPAL